MASLELINYQQNRIKVNGEIVELTKLKRKPIKGLPQILWENNSVWPEANLWALDQAAPCKLNIKTVRSNMSHLLSYAKWLESESLDWRYFPERQSERCLTRYRGALVAARNEGELAPSTTSKRMSSVIRFYKWVELMGLISPQWPMWENRIIGIKITNKFGFKHTMRVESTDLAIPNRNVAGAIDLEDGVLPVSIDSMKEILDLAEKSSSIELSLMLKIGFFTGLRLGSILDLKLQTLQKATTVPDVGWKRLEVGPRARPPVATKKNVYGKVPIPEELLKMLLEYSISTRHLKRQALANNHDKDLLFLTKFGNSYSGVDSRAVNVEMSRLRTAGFTLGLKGLNGFHFHRTRATFATEMIRVALRFMDVGDAIDFVKKACLHKDDSTTLKYIKFIENNKAMADAANTFSNAFFGVEMSSADG